MSHHPDEHRYTGHPELDLPTFYHHDFMPLERRVKELEALCGEIVAESEKAVEQNNLLTVALERAEEEVQLLHMLCDETNERLKRIESDSARKRALTSWSVMNTPGGRTDGPVLQDRI